MASFVHWNPRPLEQEMDSKLAAKMVQMGEIGVAEARRLVPVDSGQLRDSIGYTYRQSDKTLQLYADKHYAQWIEFGTSRSPAQPFLRPAMSAMARVWGSGKINLELATHGTPAKYQSGMKSKVGSHVTVGRRGLFGKRQAKVSFGMGRHS